jgi:probable HAF family extracellular repeat protein
MRKTVSRLILLGAAATLLLLAQPVSSQYEIPIADLGPSDGEGRAHEVNNQGHVVGSHEPPGTGATHFLWSAENGWLELERRGYREAYVNEIRQVATTVYTDTTTTNPLPIIYDGGEETMLGHLGGWRGLPRDINEKGEIAGDSLTADRDWHAFLWTPGGGMQDLRTLGGNRSRVLSMNDSAWVVGDSLTSDGQNHAFLWRNAEEGMTDLSTLGGDYSRALDVNNLGQVVGASSPVPGVRLDHAFLWTEEGGMIDLGTLGGSWSVAFDISESGHVVGWSDTSGNAERHAFLWTAGGGMQDLGALSGGRSFAEQVSNSGHVVGYSYLATGDTRAFFWTPDSGMIDLGTLPGGQEAQAVDINEQWQVAGWSDTPTGERHAVLWTVPGFSEWKMMDMIAQIEGLLDDGLLKTGKANALVGKLDNAIRLLDQGKIGPTCRQLEAFVNQVEAATKTGDLPDETGLELIDAANSIIGLFCE